MRIAFRALLTAAAFATLTGVACILLVYHAGTPVELWRAGSASLAGTAMSPAFLALGMLALVLGVAAGIAGRAAVPVETEPEIELPSPACSPGAVVAVRAALARLTLRLQPMLDGEVDIIAFVERVVGGALQIGASDVHIQPAERESKVLLRVHGLLEPLVGIPIEVHRAAVNRLKVLAELVTFMSDRPQDGHFTTSGPHGSAEVRVSLLPTSHGERAVLRIARSAIGPADLEGLGLSDTVRDRLRQALDSPQGLIFLTGPTGSGKTTTIYSCLGQITQARGGITHIATIEDPVEYNLPFLTQTQVHPEVGLTFAQGLRSILRQDPNVMMVGEIRDAETARIAVQAGLTGHLILTTVHADSAAGVFNRLIEMGIEPFLVASASLLSVSQRLVRALCPACRVAVPVTPDEQAWLLRRGATLNAPAYGPVGCDRCAGQGWLGRTAIFEVLEVTPAIRDLITAKVPTLRTHQAAVESGMVPLLVDGLHRAEAGLTTLSEVLRVAG